MIWRQLNHENVLPFYGVNAEEFTPRLAILVHPQLSSTIPTLYHFIGDGSTGFFFKSYRSISIIMDWKNRGIFTWDYPSTSVPTLIDTRHQNVYSVFYISYIECLTIWYQSSDLTGEHPLHLEISQRIFGGSTGYIILESSYERSYVSRISCLKVKLSHQNPRQSKWAELNNKMEIWSEWDPLRSITQYVQFRDVILDCAYQVALLHSYQVLSLCSPKVGRQIPVTETAKVLWRQILAEAMSQDRTLCVQFILDLFGSKSHITEQISAMSPDEIRAFLDVCQSVSHLLRLVWCIETTRFDLAYRRSCSQILEDRAIPKECSAAHGNLASLPFCVRYPA